MHAYFRCMRMTAAVYLLAHDVSISETVYELTTFTLFLSLWLLVLFKSLVSCNLIGLPRILAGKMKIITYVIMCIPS